MKQKITDDTRAITPDSLFLKTPQNERFLSSLPSHTQVIERSDLQKYFNTNIKIIGITGTNGKTTTAAAIYSMFLDMGHKCALLGTRGMFVNDEQIKPKGLTTPSLLELYENIDYALKLGCEYFIMEVSSHAIKQERIYGLTFCLKVLTNITSDHLDYHGTWEDYQQTKLSFLQEGNCPKVINLDDKNGALLRFFPNVFTYGIETKGNFFVNAYSLNDGLFAQISLREKKQQEKQPTSIDSKNMDIYNKKTEKLEYIQEYEDCVLESSLFGLFNLYNLMAALLAVKILSKRNLQDICGFLQNYGGVAGRMEIVSLEPLVIVDFAHTTDGMQKVFESFRTKNISVVFGAGGDRDKSKRAKMGACAAFYARKIYITSDNPRSEEPKTIANEIFKGVMRGTSIDDSTLLDAIQEKKPYYFLSQTTRSDTDNRSSAQIILDRHEAISVALRELPKDWVLLVLGKGDECVQIFKDDEIYFNDKEQIQKILKGSL